MADVIIAPTIGDETSMSDIRALLSGTKPEPAAEPVKEPVKEPEPVVEHVEAASEPAEKKQEPETVEEEPLPEGVQKRIAKEAAKAAEIQSRIDRAVSERKAKEAELKKIEAEGKGSEPVNTPQPSGAPKKPQFGEAGHENETYEQFEDRKDGWIKSEALREFETRTAENQAKAKAQERWDDAVKKHGDTFPALMEKAQELAPEGLQLAISALDAWDTVAVHLAKHPEQLKELAASYTANPVKAIATLGRIEASLSSVPKPAETKPLPEPIAKVGGNASASGKSLQDTVENGSMAELRAVLKKSGR